MASNCQSFPPMTAIRMMMRRRPWPAFPHPPLVPSTAAVGCGHNLHENLSHKSNYVRTPWLLLISVGVDSRKWWGTVGRGEIQVTGCSARRGIIFWNLCYIQEENRAKWDGGWDGRSPMRARARRASHNPTPLALMLRPCDANIKMPD